MVRAGARGFGGGEIVEVEGGHIVRSTGRKDRHSKVCTAKGPRDRRVRLSAHTAIQFYDVQDRLGFDRPSKAVDWLITKAKTAIDQLAHLPPWNPTLQNQNQQPQNDDVPDQNPQNENPPNHEILPENHHHHRHHSSSGFLPVDTDAVRSFFPAMTSSLIHFQSYPPDLLSRASSQDLRLSLQSLQQHEPILLNQNENEHVPLFAGTTPFGFDGMIAWNNHSNNDNSRGGDGGGFIFNAPSSPSPAPAPAVFFGQSQYFSQRGPLQSSNTPSVRAWVDAPSFVADHRLTPALMCPSPASGVGFAHGDFLGFRVPARIQGDEEHDGVSDKPSSASSDSRR